MFISKREMYRYDINNVKPVNRITLDNLLQVGIPERELLLSKIYELLQHISL